MGQMKDRYLIVGTGKSGMAVAMILKKTGKSILLFDSNEAVKIQDVMGRWNVLLEEKQEDLTLDEHEIQVGSLSEVQMESIKTAVISPGVPIDSPLVLSLKEKGIDVIGEIELAYLLGKGQVVGITGTNGKTTTTALTGEIMKAYYQSTYVVGNIGIPYTNVALDTKEDTVTVAEISSFQLESVNEFHPKVTAVLNITPDHLDRHHTMETYIDTKLSITKKQTKDEVCVLNYEDEVLRERSKELVPKVLFFSSKRELENGIYLNENQELVAAFDGKKECIVSIHDLKLLGMHNYENVMAAVGIAMSMGVPMEIIRRVVCEFKAVEHRIEYVAEKAGVKYYNDSKGTNPDAAIQGIRAMVTKTVLIGGGYDKGASYKEWIESFDGKVKSLILIGQTREKIKKEAEECGFGQTVFADSMEEAVKIAKETAGPGEAVLLSPACASWGMFKDYEERGRIFKKLVMELES